MWYATLLGGLVNIAGTLAGRVMLALGISVITYTGLTASLDWLKAGAITSMSGLPAQVLGMMALLKIGSCISMVCSAIAVRQTLEGLTGGTVKKWIGK